MAEIGDYTKVGVEGKFNISPSSIATFLDNPKAFYNQNIIGNTFKGNTATVFGTILHAALEQHFASGTEALTDDDVKKYLDWYSGRSDIDRDFIHSHWRSTFEVAINSGSLMHPDRQEYQTMYEIDDLLTIGGTVDYRRGKVIGDYKSCNSLKKEVGAYKYQLMTYAFVDRLNGIETTHLEIPYIQKPDPGKLSPKTGKIIGVKAADIYVATHEITQYDWDEIEEILGTMVDTMRLYYKNKELSSILFRHNPLSYRQ